MGDLISREQAIEYINRLHGGCITDDVKNFIRYQLRCVPSAEKTGLLIEGLKRPKVGERVILEITHGGEVIEIRDGLQVAGYTAIECGARMVD